MVLNDVELCNGPWKARDWEGEAPSLFAGFEYYLLKLILDESLSQNYPIFIFTF